MSLRVAYGVAVFRWGATTAGALDWRPVPTAIYLLAALVLIVMCSNLATGLRMMLTYGIPPRAEPIGAVHLSNSVRSGSPVKLGVVLLASCSSAPRSSAGHDWRATADLRAGVGVLGAASNLVG